MTLSTLIRYLFGDRNAILEIATNRHSLWIGLLFVLSAGFAREYDAEDLLHDPWHLLLPLGASLVASFGLYFWTQFVGPHHSIPNTGFLGGYLSFLGLFWMTAPLAWLYAVPYERFVEPGQAIDLNLYTLILVSVWRVALMIRVLCVCTKMNLAASVGSVLAFGCLVYAVTGTVLSYPVFAIMGGLRSFDDKTSLQKSFEGLSAICPFFIGFIAFIVAVCCSRGSASWAIRADSTPPRPRRLLFGLATASVLIWGPVLPFTQPEQQRRHEVEVAIKQERFADAVARLAAHPREAFPPVWMPPPQSMTYFTADRSLVVVLGILEEVAHQGGPDWVQEYYLRRLAWLLNHSRQVLSDEPTQERIAELLPRLPGGVDILSENASDGSNIGFREGSNRIRDLMNGKSRPGAP